VPAAVYVPGGADEHKVAAEPLLEYVPALHVLHATLLQQNIVQNYKLYIQQTLHKMCIQREQTNKQCFMSMRIVQRDKCLESLSQQHKRLRQGTLRKPKYPQSYSDLKYTTHMKTSYLQHLKTCLRNITNKRSHRLLNTYRLHNSDKLLGRRWRKCLQGSLSQSQYEKKNSNLQGTGQQYSSHLST